MREMSITIVTIGGPDDARRLFDEAMAYYDTGVVDERGNLITGEVAQRCTSGTTKMGQFDEAPPAA